jgi:hypothetical protein
MMHKRYWRTIGSAAAMLFAMGYASAACLDNRHPGFREEFLSSAAVVVGHVSGQQDLMEDREDPVGVTATVYQVEVTRSLKGAVGKRIQLRSENTSSRFPMERGRDYLLFLNKRVGDAYAIDSCGNSAAIKNVSTFVHVFDSRN